MPISRRNFLQTTGMSLAAILATQSIYAAESNGKLRVGMCDWNVRNAENRSGSANPDFIPIASKAGINGLQVSVGTSPSNIALRDPKVREKYKRLGGEHNIHFHSVAAGSILNQIPLKSEPQSAVYVIDALEAAKALGASNILMAFFGNGDLRLRDATGEIRNLSDGQFKSYELDSIGVQRVVEVLRQIAPRAEDLGIVMGLENTLTAEQNLEIMDRVGSEMLQVYYDVGNSWGNGYDVPAEIRLLGNDRICEIHIKDTKTSMLGSPEGIVDHAKAAEACKEIGFDKWYVLETSGRDKRFIEDTQTNVEYVRKMYS